MPGDKEPIHISNTKIGADNEDLVNLVISREEELINSAPA